jgi:hypothetical protein
MQKINIEVGSQLSVDFNKTTKKVKCTFTGMEFGEYIIIKIHKSNILQNLHNMLFKGHPITVRYINKGTVFGFVSSVFHITNIPDKLVFIYYPDLIEEQNVRATKRVECCLPSKVSLYENMFKGIIVDISKDGCRFDTIVPEMSNEVLIEKHLNNFISKCALSSENIKLILRLPGANHELNILCKQRSLKKDNNCVVLGLSFETMTDEDKIVLFSYLLDVEALPVIFNFPLAIIKHTVWMSRFREFLYGNKEISKKELVSHKDCELGKWLYLEGLAMFGHIAEMAKLEKVHEDLHKFVFNIVKETPEKYSNEQKQGLCERIDTISQGIIELLNKIEKQIS